MIYRIREVIAHCNLCSRARPLNVYSYCEECWPESALFKIEARNEKALDKKDSQKTIDEPYRGKK